MRGVEAMVRKDKSESMVPLQCVYELCLIANADVPGIDGILRNVFVQGGVDPSALVEYQTAQKIFVFAYFHSRGKAESIQKRIRALRLRRVHLRLKEIRPESWVDKWKKTIRPFVLTPQLMIVPSWYEKKYRTAGRIAIFIDTSLAFGTGLHETTRFVAQLIERCRKRFLTFLDVGTGTGILAIVAARCEAQRIEAIDRDPQCVRVANANFKRNNLANIKAQTMDVRQLNQREYDFVAANLVSHDLIEFAAKLVSHVRPGKFLTISGISLANLVRVRNVFRKLPVRCLRVLKGKEWAAILYRRESR